MFFVVVNKLGIAARRLLPKNRFARSVSVLAGGTAAGQLIVVAASPVLTRLYSPEDFGLLAVYLGLLGMFSVIASLRYQLAIPLPGSDEEAVSVIVVSLSAVLAMTAVSAALVGLFGTSIVALLNIPALRPYLWLFPVGLLLTGVYDVFSYWAIRKKAFPAIAKTKLTQSVGMITVQIGGYALGPVALLVGRVIGQSAGIFSLARLTLKGQPRNFASRRRFEFHQAALKYRHFPLLSTWSGLSSAAGIHLPPLLIAALLGAGSAGIFALTHRVLTQPMAVIGKAVNDVFYGEAVDAYREGALGQVVEKVYSSLVLLALPPAITIFIITPDAFAIVFGQDWAAAGEIARWMTVWLFFDFVVSPSTGIFPIINRHGVALIFQIGLLFSGVISVLVGSFVFDSLIWSVILMSMLNSLVYLMRVVTTFVITGRSAALPIYWIARYFPLSIAVNIPAVFAWILIDNFSMMKIFGLILVFVNILLVAYVTHKNYKSVGLE